MSEPVPAAIRDASGAVSRATRELKHAVSELDGAAIERATDARETAVVALRSTLETHDGFVGTARDELLAALALEAAEAEALLQGLLDEGRTMLARVRTGRRALRGYSKATDSRREPVGLDRSG